jgi:hypothetical protein
LALDAGLPLPLPTINKAKKEKPTLTEEQINRIKTYYSCDVELYLSI